MEYKNDMYNDMYKDDICKKCEKYKDDSHKDDKCKDYDKHDERPRCKGCASESEVFTSVSVPVDIEPDVKVGKIEIECCGDSIVRCERDCHKGHKIVITQKFFIKIPVCFDIKTSVGESEINCNEKK